MTDGSRIHARETQVSHWQHRQSSGTWVERSLLARMRKWWRTALQELRLRADPKTLPLPGEPHIAFEFSLKRQLKLSSFPSCPLTDNSSPPDGMASWGAREVGATVSSAPTKLQFCAAVVLRPVFTTGTNHDCPGASKQFHQCCLQTLQGSPLVTRRIPSIRFQRNRGDAPEE